jgi:hypothetical protein
MALQLFLSSLPRLSRQSMARTGNRKAAARLAAWLQ